MFGLAWSPRLLPQPTLIYWFPYWAFVAKHKGKGKRKFSLRKVRVRAAVAVGALAASTLISDVFSAAADGQYRAVSLDGQWSLEGNTAGNGPLICGVHFSDYTDAEAEEAIEAVTSISLGDKVAQERANRLVREICQFAGNDTDEVPNDGQSIKTKLNWAIPIGDSLRIFAYNEGNSQRDTGGVVTFNGIMWVKDY